MRILWVKSGGLVPPDTGGKIRSLNILKELARRHEVTLFTFYPEQADDSHPQLEQFVSRVICMPLRLPAPRSLGDFALFFGNLFSLWPYARAKYCRPEVVVRLQQLVRAERFDVIVADFLLTTAVIPWEAPYPKVIFTHNVEAQIWERHYQLARNPLWKLVAWREWRTMDHMERHYLRLADLVLTVSELDRDAFARFVPAEKIAAIPTGVDLDYFRPAQELELANQLVFTGSMDWMPNEDGILYFAKSILPRIRQEILDVTLWVVGRRPSARLQALASREHSIRVTGTVEDIRPHVHQSSVYIVPLRIGGGTRIKIFEAMAMGKAVVSTSLGAEGLPVRHGENILLADDPADFARSVVMLLKDQALRNNLGRAARQLVEEKYGWATVGDCFEAVLACIVRRS